MTEKLLKEVRYTTSRSSGPGGQHVNKTESRVTLLWDLEKSNALTEEQKVRLRLGLKSRLSSDGELLLSSQVSRSQSANKEDVTERFLDLIEKLSRPHKKRISTKPSRASKERRIKEKKQKAEKKKRRGGFEE